jgi:hypothetical protein
LPRGLALYQSIQRFSNDFTFYILCLDDEVYRELKNIDLDNTFLLERNFVSFEGDSKRGSKKEEYFSLTPAFCLEVLNQFKPDHILYLDADVYLFNDISIFFDEVADCSVAICEQRIPYLIKLMTVNYGRYNVGVNYFRNDINGENCLRNWRDDCMNWKPSDRTGLHFFSDQIYLDKWPATVYNLKVIKHKGIDTAPWNSARYNFRKVEDIFYVDDEPLVLYHFASLKKLNRGKWIVNSEMLWLDISGVLLELYREYIMIIDANSRDSYVPIGLKSSFVKRILKFLISKFCNKVIYI